MADNLVVIGRINGIYGIHGWVRVFSYTDPRARILDYSPWRLEQGELWVARDVLDGHPQGKGIVVRLEGSGDREAARGLIGKRIAVQRTQLPGLAPGEYYWADLIGLQVTTREGRMLGRVYDLMETGANDVLVVKGDRERLIPYLPGQVVLEVDREQGTLLVDWDPDF